MYESGEFEGEEFKEIEHTYNLSFNRLIRNKRIVLAYIVTEVLIFGGYLVFKFVWITDLN
jgi:hypothetical protein